VSVYAVLGSAWALTSWRVWASPRHENDITTSMTPSVSGYARLVVLVLARKRC